MKNSQTKKTYSQILPFDINCRVDKQFGRLPLSIMEFDSASKKKWECAYFEQDETSRRRSSNCEYLKNLQFSEFHAGEAEWILRYWSMKGSVVVDPFAGRATRAVVSSKLERHYTGYEISPDTFKKSKELYSDNGISPTLYLGDGCKMYNTEDESAHLVFTCPPYFNIEKYENVDCQLSSIDSYDIFLEKISECVSNIFRVLKPGGFVCWKVGDWRDSTDFRLFSHDSISIFKSNNFKIWDMIIIKNNSPFAALQAGKSASKRKTSKIHEYLLVFKKPGELDISGLQADVDLIENESANSFFDFE